MIVGTKTSIYEVRVYEITTGDGKGDKFFIATKIATKDGCFSLVSPGMEFIGERMEMKDGYFCISGKGIEILKEAL